MITERARTRRRYLLNAILGGVLFVGLYAASGAAFWILMALVFSAFGSLGLLGVNVFRWGPLDARLDERVPEFDESEGPESVFTQRRGTTRRHVEFFVDRIEIRARTLFEDMKWVVYYETVLESPVHFREEAKAPFLPFAFFGLAVLFVFIGFLEADDRGLTIPLSIGALSAGMGVSVWLIIDRMRGPMLQLSGGEFPLVIFADRPDPARVEEFCSEVLERARAYVAEHYPDQAGPAAQDPIEMLERLQSLLDRGTITQDEFERLKDETLGAMLPSEGDAPGQYL